MTTNTATAIKAIPTLYGEETRRSISAIGVNTFINIRAYAHNIRLSMQN